MEAMSKTFKPLWRAWKDFETREAGDHVLLFVFKLETDAERVLATEPWSFDKHLVLFQRYNFSILTGKEGERVILKKSHFSFSNEHVLEARFMTRKPLMWKQWAEILNHFGGLGRILRQGRLVIMFFYLFSNQKQMLNESQQQSCGLSTSIWSCSSDMIFPSRQKT